MKRNIWELEIDVSFCFVFFSFVSAYLGWESTSLQNASMRSLYQSVEFTSGSTVNVNVNKCYLSVGGFGTSVSECLALWHWSVAASGTGR